MGEGFLNGDRLDVELPTTSYQIGSISESDHFKIISENLFIQNVELFENLLI